MPQLQVSVWGGVYGLTNVGVSLMIGGMLLWCMSRVEYQSRSLLCMLMACGGCGRFRPSK